MKRHTVVFFGETERGKFGAPYFLDDLAQLMEQLGSPPKESEGLFFAIQAILYHRNVLFFRVSEEGFSRSDYFAGLKILRGGAFEKKLDALCLPGVGDPEILEESHIVCALHKSPLITSQKDLYDYLTFDTQDRK